MKLLGGPGPMFKQAVRFRTLSVMDIGIDIHLSHFRIFFAN